MPCRGVGRKKERKAHLERIQATTITPRTEVSPSTHAPSAKLGAPFLPHRHTRPFFFSSFIDLNSFSASNTRNRPTFSHPLLCGRLIFGHLRSIGDHFWENKAPFQVGGLATRAHLDHQRRSEQGGAAPPLVWAQRVGWGVWSWVHQLIKRKNSSCSTNIGRKMRKVLSVDVGPSNSWGGESR